METSKTKRSRQREAILRVLQSTESHPTADWIYDTVRQQIPNISLGTVYRNLAKLTQSGDILRLDVGDGMDHYDATTTPHYHLFCRKCGHLQDLTMDYQTHLDTEAAHSFNGDIHGHALVFYGTCQNCRHQEH